MKEVDNILRLLVQMKCESKIYAKLGNRKRIIVRGLIPVEIITHFVALFDN